MGSNPAWVKGYIPTAAEWNGEWTSKADDPVVATGSTQPRAVADRFGDWVNVKDFGAKLNGTAGVDGPAIGAALATLQPQESLYFPGGNASIVWGSAQGTIPSTPVRFLVDGTLSSGAPMLQAFNRNNKGDVFETFNSGLKILSKASAEVDSAGVLRIDHTNTGSVGSAGFISTPIRVNATDWTGAVDSMWGVHVALTSKSNQTPWPQNVGVSSTVLKFGFGWVAGMHITASDRQNLPSSTGGTMLGMEIGYHTNAADDTLNGSAFGGIGTRMGLHLSLSEENGAGVLPAQISFGILADGTTSSLTKSVYAVSQFMHTYQVLDARGATVPAGYTDPLAAVRMLHEQIVDFNGGAALNSNAGNYLQYTTTGTARLRYMVGATERFTLPDTKPTVTGSRAGNAALASLLTTLAAANLITDSTSA